jgi:phosphate/sulfate permease
MNPEPLENAGGLVACAILGCLVVAIANGANDIANSMGTSFGAGALTLRQAISYGAAAEFAGAVLLGSSVAKTISKGVINPHEYAEDGCEGVLMFAVGMISVLAGTGSTTLLATLYGLPISASHGVIGGLLAVGLVSHGSAGIGWAPLEQTVVAWVASPLLGGITAGALNFVVTTAVHRTRAPARRAQLLQPLFVAVTVAVAVAFILITGPSAVKVRPVGPAVLISLGLG